MCPEVLQKVAHLGNIDHLKTEVENWSVFTERIEEAVVEVEKQRLSVCVSLFADKCYCYLQLCKLVYDLDITLTLVFSVAIHCIQY